MVHNYIDHKHLHLNEKLLQTQYAGLLKYLSKKLNRHVVLKLFDEYVDLAAQLQNGSIDLVTLSSYNYVKAKRKYPNIEILVSHVTSGGTSYEGFILARANENIKSIHDLKGKTFCYVNPNSTSGYLYPRAIFRKNQIDPDNKYPFTKPIRILKITSVLLLIFSNKIEVLRFT